MHPFLPYNYGTSHLQAGLDSFGAMDLRTAIEGAFGIHIAATVVFDYPNINAMAAYIQSQVLPQPTAQLIHTSALHQLARDTHPSVTAVVSFAGTFPQRTPGKPLKTSV